MRNPSPKAIARRLARWEVRLGAALLLFAGELWVLMLALHPDVDAAYRAHYLVRPTSCWVPSGLRATLAATTLPPDIAIATLRWPQRCRVLQAGWSEPAGPARIVGRRAILLVPVRHDTSAVVLTLAAPPAPASPQVVQITDLESAPSQPVRMAAGTEADLRLPISAATRLRGSAELHLRVETPTVPGMELLRLRVE